MASIASILTLTHRGEGKRSTIRTEGEKMAQEYIEVRGRGKIT